MSNSIPNKQAPIIVSLDSPFTDQKPGTSGLRKSSKHFAQKNYLESFVEAIFQTLPGVQGGTLVLGGDGRYGNENAINVIIAMGAAHGLKKIITTTKGILSTPAASHLIRSQKAIGGIILSASHNSGGPDGDFGVKINGPNGGPASEALTNSIYECTKSLKEYQILQGSLIPLDQTDIYSIGSMKVEVIDGVEDYISLMEKLFDFDKIASLLRDDFKIVFDAMHAVTGPYAKQLLEKVIGAPNGTVRNYVPLTDFGGGHPDPNLTYAKELADLLLNQDFYDFGAACDGDGDRNMILGKSCFVNPSDSLAVLTANSSLVPAYANGLIGVARSMPTSSAVDVVAKDLQINAYETPTGWKFFGNLLDKNLITICGEESFGTGSNHIREKDGLWAVLFWLQILAEKKCTVYDVMQQHWNKYGRHYYSRHDYEEIPINIANEIYSKLEQGLPSLSQQKFAGHLVTHADNFSYEDSVDGSITTNQGLRILLEGNNRVILRLSGTGTKGATLRIYLERYVSNTGDLNQNPQKALSPLITAINDLTKIHTLSGKNHPSVIT